LRNFEFHIQEYAMGRFNFFTALAVIVILPLLALAQSQSSSNDKSSSNQPAPTSDQVATPRSCAARSLLLNFEDDRDHRTREVPIWRLGDQSAFFFSAGMTIDADGSPDAYNPYNTGRDDLANAGEPGHWDGIIVDIDGNPLIQGEGDPFPGFYISCTSLSDRTKSRDDPTRYVDASTIPYVVLPGWLAREVGARLGDFAVVLNQHSQKISYAIFADIGTLGEGSVALADNLGIWSNARAGGRRGGVFYLVFPGTGDGQPRTVDEINQEAAKAFADWGGMQQLNSCVDQSPAIPPATRADNPQPPIP
jgi:hypothetical protein